ncbi:NADP-dependent oxidoreductase [Testudinibacter sp. TR-2022]|uniref:NADP-dependent oxidoreductase n=1 Tax=Testudinibacter sp. TR-2022 TaxID=2585029 RepID=UPI00111AD58E|nr:NADP-dependent oxidoreductase [Testudinibacter sp. TR-2022]TNH02463.1 NADP-dependent oxidoreductase [Pasteurellaceae bacterium Phil31]TNH09881.1 NADP-dependent oxidoreductase [Testudinibacter sp. TR-2022]TNH10563.1 NADP-dependent oxidoreductase [Testudinibacter sp. TR-2022]TNH13634.1 NADP-dependent oxidoreductase [Testudinibacter sp. TR-2022]TNH18158.1 NADP-dependent oxidoreductase [Testudinibacter sp. TR-2022]
MQAVFLNEAGGADALYAAETAQPVPASGEVLVKVAAIGINPADIAVRSDNALLGMMYGEQRPVILGWDIAGTVVACGADVTAFKAGDEVFGMVNFPGNGSAYAEYTAAPAAHLALKPPHVSHEQAAASCLAACTAYQALLDIAAVKAGDKVLVHGASGGVGHFAVQIAKACGAYVAGTSSAQNRDLVLSLGADEHIDYRSENVSERLHGFDIVLETAPGNLLSSIAVLRSGGKIVSTARFEYGADVSEQAAAKQIAIDTIKVRSQPATITALATLLASGACKPHIHQTFAFADLRAAHSALENRQVTAGKVVLNGLPESANP